MTQDYVTASSSRSVIWAGLPCLNYLNLAGSLALSGVAWRRSVAIPGRGRAARCTHRGRHLIGDLAAGCPPHVRKGRHESQQALEQQAAAGPPADVGMPCVDEDSRALQSRGPREAVAPGCRGRVPYDKRLFPFGLALCRRVVRESFTSGCNGHVLTCLCAAYWVRHAALLGYAVADKVAYLQSRYHIRLIRRSRSCHSCPLL